MSRVVNILNITNSLLLGGAEVALENLIRQTEGRSISSGVIQNHVVSLTGGGPVGERLCAAGIPVTTFNTLRSFDLVSAPVQIARRIRQHSSVIVSAWMYWSNLVGGLASSLAGRVPLIWGIHHYSPDEKSMRWPLRCFVGLSRHLSPYLPQATVYVSKSTYTAHKAAGFDSHKARIIYNGIDVERFQPDPEAPFLVRQELGLAEDAVLIGFSARFDPVKDHALFLAALARLQTPKVHAILCGIGTHPENGELMALIKSQGAELARRIHLLGAREDMPCLVASWDLAVSSSWGEGFSLAMGEALCSGVPCVSTNIGEITQLVEQAGRVVRTREPGELARAIDSVLALSPEERRALGRRGRQGIAENYAMEACAKNWMALYDEVAREGGTPNRIAS